MKYWDLLSEREGGEMLTSPLIRMQILESGDLTLPLYSNKRNSFFLSFFLSTRAQSESFVKERWHRWVTFSGLMYYVVSVQCWDQYLYIISLLVKVPHPNKPLLNISALSHITEHTHQHILNNLTLSLHLSDLFHLFASDFIAHWDTLGFFRHK